MSLAVIAVFAVTAALIALAMYALLKGRSRAERTLSTEHYAAHENTLEVLRERYGTDHGDREVERDRWREAS